MHTASGRVLTAGVAVVGRLGRFNKADCDFKPSEVADQERAVHLRRMLTPAEVPGLPDGVKAIGVVRLHACLWRCAVAHRSTSQPQLLRLHRAISARLQSQSRKFTHGASTTMASLASPLTRPWRCCTRFACRLSTVRGLRHASIARASCLTPQRRSGGGGHLGRGPPHASIDKRRSAAVLWAAHLRAPGPRRRGRQLRRGAAPARGA